MFFLPRRESQATIIARQRAHARQAQRERAVAVFKAPLPPPPSDDRATKRDPFDRGLSAQQRRILELL
jgi:hypothetical protein